MKIKHKYRFFHAGLDRETMEDWINSIVQNVIELKNKRKKIKAGFVISDEIISIVYTFNSEFNRVSIREVNVI